MRYILNGLLSRGCPRDLKFTSFFEQLRLEEHADNRLKISLDDKILQIVYRYEPRDFKNFTKISSEGIHIVDWRNTKVVIIKKLGKSSMKEAIDEICLTGLIGPCPNIILFYGVTKLNETNYSLVLDYAEGGTLGRYLRDNTITFKWKSQLKFAKEISSAILWLHVDKGIIHGDLHPNNVLIQKGTIKLADFGCSCLKGSKSDTVVRGVIPYMDPRFFEQSLCSSETQRHPYPLTEKADIYSLGVLFWELTSRKSPFDYETKNNDRFEKIKIMSNIFRGMREKPSPGTNHKFVALYEKCWQHKPDERPEIRQVILELNNIEPSVVLENFISKDIETIGESQSENEEVIVPSDDDLDIKDYNL